MTSDGGGWMKILQYGTEPYTPTAAAVGNIAVAGIPAMAKMADADVNKLAVLSTEREYRIKGATSTKSLFMKSAAIWDDPARGHGLILTGKGYACEATTNCTYVEVTTPAGRPTIDSNDWSPSSIETNNEDRYFTDYSGTPNCYATESLTQRCYGTGITLNHALIPNLEIWVRELPVLNEAILTYRLDEGSGTVIVDSSGGYNATVVDGSWIAGHIGSAFKGAFRTDEGIHLNDEVTISLWVRRDGPGPMGYPRIVSVLWDALEVADIYNSGVLGIYSPALGWQSTGASFGTGFHHVAVTAGAGSAAVYYDGAFVYGAPQAVSLGPQISFGRRYNNEEPWVGALDQVRIYDRALNPSEIAILAAE